MRAASKKIKTFLLLSLFPLQSYAVCTQHVEAEALGLTALKSSLMVAALSCSHQESYNNFISEHQSLLATQGNVVKTFFEKHYGDEAQAQLNKFMTNLANQASQHSMSFSDNYCDDTAELFDIVTRSNRHDLLQLAVSHDYQDLHNISECTTNVKLAEKN